MFSMFDNDEILRRIDNYKTKHGNIENIRNILGLDQHNNNDVVKYFIGNCKISDDFNDDFVPAMGIISDDNRTFVLETPLSEEVLNLLRPLNLDIIIYKLTIDYTLSAKTIYLIESTVAAVKCDYLDLEKSTTVVIGNIRDMLRMHIFTVTGIVMNAIIFDNCTILGNPKLITVINKEVKHFSRFELLNFPIAGIKGEINHYTGHAFSDMKNCVFGLLRIDYNDLNLVKYAQRLIVNVYPNDIIDPKKIHFEWSPEISPTRFYFWLSRLFQYRKILVKLY